jgi:glycosyltransferase involved in cell wall biosynthesis
VALICHEYPPYQIGGVGTYTHDLAAFLSKRKVPTTVFCGKSRQVIEEQVNEYLTIVRLPLLDFPLRAYWFQIRNQSLLRRKLREFDLVHAVNPQSSAVCAFVKPKNLPMLTTVHDVPVFRTKAFFKAPISDWCLHDFVSNFVELPVNEILYRSCFRESESVVAVSHNVLREIEIAFREVVGKITVIHNGIDFEKVRLESATGSGCPNDYVLFYGRHVTVKGIPLLLRSIAELQPAFPDLQLVVVGTGPQSGHLHKLARELNLLKNIRFLGHVDKLVPLIMNCSFVVLPSTYEVFPFTVLEAMSCGKAVIALDYPFSREVIEDFTTGLLSKPGEPHDLANKIEFLIKDQDFRNQLGDNALKYVHDHFNWQNLVDSYIELYRDVVTR